MNWILENKLIGIRFMLIEFKKRYFYDMVCVIEVIVQNHI